MLQDAEIERFARQILVPEIGGRGQERLLAATVAVAGTGIAARQAAELLRRAGARVAGAGAARADVVMLLDAAPGARGPAPETPLVAGAVGPDAAVLVVATHSPCPRCLPPELVPTAGAPSGPAGVVAGHALGALAATEALLLVLDPRRPSRRIVLEHERGTAHATMLALPPCAHCPHQA